MIVNNIKGDKYIMNELQKTNKDDIRISSREVAEMMGIRHGDLLDKIDKINDDLKWHNIDYGKYWIESLYKTEGNNKTYREYQVTKLGCELLIQKSTGKKGYLLADKLNDLFSDETNSIIIIDLNRKEIEFLDKLEESLKPFNIKGKRQYSVLNYRIDYYIPSLNIAIEYDENEHKNYTYEQHEGRQKEIEKELGCRFIRVHDGNTDNYNIGFIIKNIFKL
nr:MAG TPA: regulatory protein [Caudoviricetes sp.]